MAKDTQSLDILKLLKLITYISATVILITGTGFDKLTYLIPLIVLLFFINYFRDYYLITNKKPAQYIWTSIILELLLIISIGILGKTDVNILFFYVFISSITISYPFAYSLSLAALYMVLEFVIFASNNGFDRLLESIVSLFFSYGVSTAFVMIMSYVMKMQVREKEKLSRINAELELAYKKLIETSAASQKLIVEQERTRMAREIHDTLAHTLTSLIIQLEACKRLAALDPSRLQTELEKAQELSRSGFNDVKRSIKALRPQIMEDKSFFASIVSIINDTMKNTKANIKLNNFLAHDIKLPSQIEVGLFRAIQESITNSIRHGDADEINISIEQANGNLQLSIDDNGTGCENIKKGYGIQGIMERIGSLKGTAQFSSSPGKGFRTKISIPYKEV